MQYTKKNVRVPLARTRRRQTDLPQLNYIRLAPDSLEHRHICNSNSRTIFVIVIVATFFDVNSQHRPVQV